jgi:hypothetical protein
MPAIQDTVATGTITHRTTAHPTPCTGRFTVRPRIIRETQAIVRRPTVNLDIARRRPTANLDIVHQLVSPDIVRRPINREIVRQPLNRSGRVNRARDRQRRRTVPDLHSHGQVPTNRPQDRSQHHKPVQHHRPNQRHKIVRLHRPNQRRKPGQHHKPNPRHRLVRLHKPNQRHKAVRLHKPNRSNNLSHRTPVAAVHKGSRHKGSHAVEAANRTRARGMLVSMRACNLL